MISNKEEIKPTTSEWIEVRKSSIHSTGVFAAKDIPKGTKIIEYVGRKMTKKESDEIADRDLDAHSNNSENGAVYIFELNKKYDIDGNVPYNTARFINHACETNAEAEIIKGKIWIIATREIKKGEEILYDYGYDLENWQEHPCQCSSKNCIGYIVAEEDRIKLKKILEKKNINNA